MPQYPEAMKQMEKGNFHSERYYFVFDSEHLNQVTTQLYGFAVTDQRIVDSESKESLPVKELNGNGCYIYVNREKSTIDIYQDYLGCFGLYIFRSGSYYAISNSCTLLADYVKSNHHLTFNKDTAFSYLATGLCSLAYSDTMYHEITMFGRNEILHIDVDTGRLYVDFVDYHENTVEIDSSEGMRILDQWSKRWEHIIRGLCEETDRVTIDLTGGFDSRMVFMLLLKSGVDLKKININSNPNVKDHSYAEDYAIATQISEKYGFKLGVIPSDNDAVPLSQEEVMTAVMNSRLGCSKQALPYADRMRTTRFHFTGYGGECIRKYWSKRYDIFIRTRQKETLKYPEQIWKDMNEGIEKTLTLSAKSVIKKYQLQEKDPNVIRQMYRETRCRFHLGRHMVESCTANSYSLAPLFDPELAKLKLCTAECEDENLLIAVIFNRFFPDLLNFRFDSGKCIEEDTLAYAKKITEKYAAEHYVSTENSKMIISVNHLVEDEPNVVQGSVLKAEKEILDRVTSVKTRDLFAQRMDPRVYDVLVEDIKTREWKPMMAAYTILSITRAIQDEIDSQEAEKKRTAMTQMDMHKEEAPIHFETQKEIGLKGWFKNFFKVK